MKAPGYETCSKLPTLPGSSYPIHASMENECKNAVKKDVYKLSSSLFNIHDSDITHKYET